MPYCRKCGAKLEENERFCHVCGTPVAGVGAIPAHQTIKRRPRPYLLPVIILVAVLLAAIIISALVFVPLTPVNFNQTNSVGKEDDVDRLTLDLQADIAEVNVIPQHLGDKALVLNVSATGWIGMFGSANPVGVTFNNVTANRTTIVTSQVSRIGARPFSDNLRVICNVYIDPSAILNVLVRSSVGPITMDADGPMTFQSLTLWATTGNVEANLTHGVVINGSVWLRTTTGSVQFRMDNAEVSDNIPVNLQSTTGSVTVYVTENERLSGNVTLDAATTTGSVNLAMTIRDDVGARIESQTTLGGITVDVQRFSGNKSPLQSNNYPAGSNFLVSLRTTTGGIDINADYELGGVLS